MLMPQRHARFFVLRMLLRADSACRRCAAHAAERHALMPCRYLMPCRAMAQRAATLC
jgi:hypothetical protein